MRNKVRKEDGTSYSLSSKKMKIRKWKDVKNKKKKK